MILIFLSIHLNNILVSGLSLSEQVHQTPADMFKQPGEEAKFNCFHTISNYDKILWYKQTNEQLQFLGYMNINNGYPENGAGVKIEGGAEKDQNCTLTIERLKLSSSAVYFCAARLHNREAYFGGGTKLTVLGKDDKITPPTVKVLEPSEKECRNKVEKEKRKKTLLCVISRFYPDHVNVTWKINNEEMSKGVATDNMPAQPNDGEFYKITSRLKVDANKWFDPENEFKCIASFFNGTGTTYHENGTRGIEAPKTGQNITTEAYLKRSQTAKLSYGVLIIKGCVYGAFVMFLVWKLPGSSGKRNN
uniref:Ig-like domain-containing protein n=1 Tax=Sparus aurata TaxID=8175 RepID=A0A671XFA8_SPAAU